MRSIGSGNIGATNVLRTGHKGLAAATLLLDMLKGTAAVVIAGYFDGPNAAMLAALGAFLGHLFPVWLKFRGGKGVAVYIGVLLGLFWPAALAFCVIWLATAVASRYSSLAALVASSGHADLSVVARPSRAGRAVRSYDSAAVLYAPRKHQAVAGGHRGKDRAEGVAPRSPMHANQNSLKRIKCCLRVNSAKLPHKKHILFATRCHAGKNRQRLSSSCWGS